MRIFFTSDQHFFHRGILKHRPKFSSVDEMNHEIIARHNSVVSNNDTVYYLGDFSFGKTDQTIEVLKQLNGQKNLILGNHDFKRIKEGMHRCFGFIKNYHEIKYEGNMYVLFHFPILSWNKVHYGSIHLHGHSHGNLNVKISPVFNPAFYYYDQRALDVGVDVHDYYPIEITQVSTIMKNRHYNPLYQGQDKNHD